MAKFKFLITYSAFALFNLPGLTSTQSMTLYTCNVLALLGAILLGSLISIIFIFFFRTFALCSIAFYLQLLE
jgi:hypothetical protein